mmetsp:Transcript_15643/g.62997  ORF Transcript_15643/g.62997 Transcript_15643/m.62997 type:complete len:270 (-) Transcript_15643:489-1298(-)
MPSAGDARRARRAALVGEGDGGAAAVRELGHEPRDRVAQDGVVRARPPRVRRARAQSERAVQDARGGLASVHLWAPCFSRSALRFGRRRRRRRLAVPLAARVDVQRPLDPRPRPHLWLSDSLVVRLPPSGEPRREDAPDEEHLDAVPGGLGHVDENGGRVAVGRVRRRSVLLNCHQRGGGGGAPDKEVGQRVGSRRRRSTDVLLGRGTAAAQYDAPDRGSRAETAVRGRGRRRDAGELGREPRGARARPRERGAQRCRFERRRVLMIVS